jgi:DNA-binding PadR family transcriptional regulator
MSTIDLMILGILTEGPKSAYEITNHIADRQVTRLLKVSDPAVYKSCKRMYQNGFLKGKLISAGAQPKKTVYSLNSNGKKRFYDLMTQYSSDIKPFFIEFNTFIWNLDKVEKEDGLKMLCNLKDELKTMESWIVEHEREAREVVSIPARLVIKQYAMLISTLVNWSIDAINEYKKIQ